MYSGLSKPNLHLGGDVNRVDFGLNTENLTPKTNTHQGFNDETTYRHCTHTAVLCRELGKELKLPPEFIDDVTTAAAFHDIGKNAIRNEIIQKPDGLTPIEYARIKTHPIIGYKILSHLSPESRKAILFHHERKDGSGYFGIRNGSIPLSASILSVADVYDAATDLTRPERKIRQALSPQQAFNMISRDTPTSYDQNVVNALDALLERDFDHRSIYFIN